MADTTQGSPDPTASAPAEAPALTPEQVSDIVTQAIDARMPGYMSTVDKRINSLQQEVQRASMTTDEIEEADEQSASAELEALKRQNAILAQQQEYPEAVAAYMDLQSKADGKEQLEYLQALIKPAAPSEDAQGGDEGGTPDDDAAPPTDPNRAPAVPPDAAQESADDAILGAFQSWPGADFFKRG
jgi:hypothetical protein